MTEQPEYKSLKVTFETWQLITRLSAQTGEPRTRLIERVMKAEEEKLKSLENAVNVASERGRPG